LLHVVRKKYLDIFRELTTVPMRRIGGDMEGSKSVWVAVKSREMQGK
jgi:hypothetical protein